MEYEIKGGAFPMVICTLQKGETMQNETGAMAYMTSDIKMETNIGGGLLKGIGRALSGDTVFLEIDGEVIERELAPGEKLLVDPGHIAIMEETINFDIERVKGVKNMLFGEGLFFAKLEGPGKVWIQTMPISRLAEAIVPYVPTRAE